MTNDCCDCDVERFMKSEGAFLVKGLLMVHWDSETREWVLEEHQLGYGVPVELQRSPSLTQVMAVIRRKS